MFSADKVNYEKIDHWYSLGYQSLFRKGASFLLGPLGTVSKRAAGIEPTTGRLAENFSLPVKILD